MPQALLARTGFRTVLPTPAALRAQRKLVALQGQGGLYFAGHVMAEIDSQEAAIASAVEVARLLAPDSRRSHRLTHY